MQVLGINTGTSVDAVDLCLVDWQLDNLKAFKVLAEKTYPFEAPIKLAIEKLINKQNGNLSEISNLNFKYSRFIAKLINQFQQELDDTTQIDLIGFHGQTIFHGEQSTWQIGDGSLVAKLTDIPTFSDFRPADMAVGGQGAPLISFLDHKLIREIDTTVATLNIGGIANLTIMPVDEATIAYDTGPGNILIDLLMKRLFQRDFDRDGSVAFSGKVNHSFMDRILKATDYFDKTAPKTTGRELFNLKYAEKFLDIGNKQDIISTASHFTIHTISQELAKFSIKKLYISGGGCKNKYLIQELEKLHPGIEFRSHNELKINDQYKEALLFSLLAFTSFHQIPNNIPSSTGAKIDTILGKLSYAKPNAKR